MATTQYIGARYVPLFYTNPDDNSNNWKSGVVYDPLTVVTDLNQSYTSKIPVPASVGRPSENPTYWILTGAYSAQIEQYRAEVAGVVSDMEDLTEDVAGIREDVEENSADIIRMNDRAGYGVAQIGVYDAYNLNRTTDGLQGAWASGSMWYQYVYTGGTSGKILSFNMASGRYDTMIDKDLYHGNDFVSCGGYIYGAPYDDGNGHGVNKLLRFTLSGLVSELNPFASTGYDCLYGVDKIDEDTLICALRPYGTNEVDSTAFYLYHITDETITPVPVSWNGLAAGQNGFPHPIIYRNGKIYLAASSENGFYILDYVNGALNAVAYNSIPKYTAFGYAISEIEGWGMVSNYGDNWIVFTTHTDPDAFSILFCAINLTGSSPASMLKDSPWSDNQQINFALSYADMGLIFENGSGSYPIKSLTRACIAASKSYGSGIAGNIFLPSVVNETNKQTIRIRANHVGITAPSGGCRIVNPILFIRTKANVGGPGSVTFESDLTLNANANIRFMNGNNVFHGIGVADSLLREDAPNSHLGSVNISGSTYYMSILPEQTPNVVTSRQCLLQVNKPEATGFTVGGGATLLTSGIK